MVCIFNEITKMRDGISSPHFEVQYQFHLCSVVWLDFHSSCSEKENFEEIPTFQKKSQSFYEHVKIYSCLSVPPCLSKMLKALQDLIIPIVIYNNNKELLNFKMIYNLYWFNFLLEVIGNQGILC